MYRPTAPSFVYLAPGASGYAPVVLPGARTFDLPPVDEHVVEPETRQEMIDGRIVEVAPASPPHAELHFAVDYVLRASVAPGYVGTTDMLTRTSQQWNFAADAAIRKVGTDPETGHRYLEELAFEIKHKQSMADITARARQLAGRGVRRVFAICVFSKKVKGEDVLVKAGPVMEWMPGEDRWTEGAWVELDADAVIEDPCLRCPIRVRALLDATEADDAVARALLARDNPVLQQAFEDVQDKAETQGFQQGQTEGYQQGQIQTLRHAIRALCQVLGIELTPAHRAELDALDAGGLQALHDGIAARRRWPAP